MPKHVYLNLEGIGWDILRKQLGVKLPAVIIPLERPAETHKIVGSTLPAIFASQVGNLKINHIVTDTLFVSIEPKDSIKMKIMVDPALISFKEGFGRTSPIVVLPDSILIDGPKSVIGPLGHSPILVTLPENTLNSNYRQQIEITDPNGESVNRRPGKIEGHV